ncbi:flagellar basal body-associated protein FliL [Salinicola halophilus]|uniref:flagellar basal body-associated protein FliL n=1 Tax=Salinicola halophilus TaxID=184065 RepID=UPI000DA238F0|nr:flagellar basal body-associated protein FliL [Salinicola halophilus]
MADATAAPKAASGKKRSLILIGLLVVLLSIACSVAAFFYLDSRGTETHAETAAAEEEPAEPPVPIFVTVSPFTVNLQSDYSDRLLYVGVSLRVNDQQTSDFLTQHMPEVRSRLLMLLSGKRAEDLVSPEGKVELKREILALFDEPITSPQPTLAIDDVLFSDFIVQ